VHNSGRSGHKYLPETLGSGAAFLDFDGDGWLDVLLVNGKDRTSRGPRYAGSPSTPAGRLHAARLRSNSGGMPMAIHKVIEVLSQSEKGWEDAAQRAVKDASKSVRHIKSIYVKNMEGVVRNDTIVEFRINANITFELEG
jgi:flavin-binding protein dodecin